MDTPLSLLVALISVGAAFLYALWPLLRPQTAHGVLPEEERAGPLSRREVARLLMEREQAYKNIMEVELDREMGKLSDEDYAEMMAPVRARAVEVLRRLEARGVGEGVAPLGLGEREAVRVASRIEGVSAPAAPESPAEESIEERLEAEILRYRKTADSPTPTPPAGAEKAKARFCPGCGSGVEEADNFCAACGRKLR